MPAAVTPRWFVSEGPRQDGPGGTHRRAFPAVFSSGDGEGGPAAGTGPAPRASASAPATIPVRICPLGTRPVTRVPRSGRDIREPDTVMTLRRQGGQRGVGWQSTRVGGMVGFGWFAQSVRYGMVCGRA